MQSKLFVNNSKFALLASICATALFASCKKDRVTDPLDSGNIEENQLRGSISGVVLDTAAHGVPGVSVVTVPTGFSTTTDSSGNYSIPNVLAGTYELRFSKSNWRDTSYAGVKIAVDQDKKSVNMVMRRKLDTSIIIAIDTSIKVALDSTRDRQVVGNLTDYARLAKVELIAVDNNGKSVPLTVASWNGSGQYSSRMKVPKTGGKLTAIIRDGSDLVMGIAQVGFDSSANQITVPVVAASNAMPIARAGADFTAFYGEKFNLIDAGSTDPMGIKTGLAAYAWSLDGAAFVDAAQGALTVTMPSTGTSHRLVLRVKDADGNTDYDTAMVSMKEVVKLRDIVAGSFDMGLDDGVPDAAPVHRESVAAFKIGVSEITVAQFALVMNKASGLTVSGNEVYLGSRLLFSTEQMTGLPGSFGAKLMNENNPIVNVTWAGMALFCNALSESEGLEKSYSTTAWNFLPGKNGYRLPTESEWEYAARAGQSTVYAGSDNVDEVAWTADNIAADFGSVTAVKQKLANAWGLYDMSGNAAEMTEGAYAVPYGSSGNSSQRAVKGGDGEKSANVSPLQLGSIPFRIGNRQAFSIAIPEAHTGFRIARNP